MTDLNIIFEDEDLLAVCKPPGLLSVPGRVEPHCLSAQALEYNANCRVIHRLDMATSGLVLFAKHHLAQKNMGKLFEQRKIQKTYHAIVEGIVIKEAGAVDLPLICDWPNRPRQKICYDTGKAALTHYTCIYYDQQQHTTFLHLKPVTGRSHQLRIHMASIGHPILGDQLYHSERSHTLATRLMLHATELCFDHPITHEPIILTSPSGFADKLQ